ncbi:beta-galactosidase GalB [Zunongwangia sp.]|uniref:beta-galactosidase GalB n=1 Tax=Zunongwangia sp. TaxID=1965325 RepID=UPI003AA7D480
MNALKRNFLVHYYVILLIVILASSCSKSQKVDSSIDRKQDFTDNWQFQLNADITDPESVLNSGAWETRQLPHDWSIAQDFDQNSRAGIGGGALNGGLGWYKKTFKVAEEDTSKITKIVFDGVYQNSSVWINGKLLGNRPNGYIGFEYNLTPYLHFRDKENTILVKADNNNQPNSRWYSGSGIYRNVWLKTVHKVHIPQWGTFITTPQVSTEKATIQLTTKVENESATSQNVQLETKILFGNKTVATTTSKVINIDSNKNQEVAQKIEIKNPDLWSVNEPNLYQAVARIKIDNEVVDKYTTTFGIRYFKFDLEKGFLLNGESVKIKGVCMHHDLGPLGAAVNTRAIERQLEILKEMGVNGIRTAHNAPAPELLDLCDKMGFIVMDEAFDMWTKAKTENDYSQFWDKWHKRDLEDLIKRDRNHPSIFMWSIGNEIQEQWSEKGAEIGRELSKIVKNLDTTRLVTAGMNPPIHVNNKEVTIQFEETADQPNALAGSGALDIIGYNYAHQTWEKHQTNFPNIPFIATETTSGLETRGYYEFPSDTTKIWPVRWDKVFTGGNPDNTVSAFDQVRAPWGSLHETSWKIIKKHDFLSGFYIWTGFDYIGEPTPYEWPSRSSYFGIIDLAGFPKDVYYMYKSEWTTDTVLHVLPHWNWKKDQTVDVWAYYNNADEVELFINGKSKGIKKKTGDQLHVMWRFPFEAGTLKAVSRKDGEIVKETLVKTADKPAQLKLSPDRKTIKADNKDLSFITVTITDKDDVLTPRADNNISFSIEGDGEIVGVASGDPTNHQSFKGTEHRALNGKCLVIVKAGKNAGTLKVTASSKGLQAASCTLTMVD